MSTATQVKRKAKTIDPMDRRFAELGISEEDAVNRQRGVREFIAAMSAELAVLAYQNRLDSLAVLFDMAREAAEEKYAGASKRLKRC